ncbi:hypothetical protein D3C73_1038840 [compost metagenome]
MVKNAGDLAATRCFYNGDVIDLDVALLELVGGAGHRIDARGFDVLGQVTGRELSLAGLDVVDG